MDHNRRLKKSVYKERYLLPNGNFYYKIYEDKTGTFFSDPPTANCENIEELKAAINKKPQIQMRSQEHFNRMQECNEMKAKYTEMKENKNDG